MKSAVDMGSGVMIYIPSFIKIGLGIQKLLRGGYTDTQTGRRSGKTLFIFFQNKEIRLKVCNFHGKMEFYVYFSNNYLKNCSSLHTA
jgi:hypothetical protein